ncbi:cytochrome P450 78A5 [Gossypium australe]|uniref:Cytochrome P450 78A5 n=1 Tax=Gossypium australe TaxID=47621 RepID=A0A5B6URY4_9ROSI|nr:cytochrome P450 78A5 [Gossypium australe]
MGATTICAIHDVHVGYHLVPAGTTAMVNVWAITLNEDVWADAEKFRLERFMEEDVGRCAWGKPWVWQRFIYGRLSYLKDSDGFLVRMEKWWT